MDHGWKVVSVSTTSNFQSHEPTVGIGHDTPLGTHRALDAEPQFERKVKQQGNVVSAKTLDNIQHRYLYIRNSALIVIKQDNVVSANTMVNMDTAADDISWETTYDNSATDVDAVDAADDVTSTAVDVDAAVAVADDDASDITQDGSYDDDSATTVDAAYADTSTAVDVDVDCYRHHVGCLWQ